MEPFGEVLFSRRGWVRNVISNSTLLTATDLVVTRKARLMIGSIVEYHDLIGNYLGKGMNGGEVGMDKSVVFDENKNVLLCMQKVVGLPRFPYGTTGLFDSAGNRVAELSGIGRGKWKIVLWRWERDGEVILRTENSKSRFWEFFDKNSSSVATIQIKFKSMLLDHVKQQVSISPNADRLPVLGMIQLLAQMTV
ncbi:MAG: hypothetical protein JRN15_13585 [Nitrososphaerota archaeon]|nr:hypothetical protein [Nitrososphaerota archaeon]